MRSSKNILKFWALSAFVLILAAISVTAQFNWERTWQYSEKAEPVAFEPGIDENDAHEIMARWDAIKKEEHTKDIEGIYRLGGEIHVSYIAVSEKYGFIKLTINLCNASVHRAIYGNARIVGEKITFYPLSKAARPNGSHSENTDRLPFEMIGAKWNGADYLIEEENVAQFCDSIAGVDSAMAVPYYDQAGFYGRQGNGKGSAYDLPVLPANYQYLIKKPVNGKVAAVGKRIVQKSVEPRYSTGEENEITYESITTLRLNIGSDNGIKEGMRLYVLVPNGCCPEDMVEITSVSKNSSTGIVTRDVERTPKAPLDKLKDDEHYRPLQIGQIITTSWYIFSEYQFSLPEKN